MRKTDQEKAIRKSADKLTKMAQWVHELEENHGDIVAGFEKQTEVLRAKESEVKDLKKTITELKVVIIVALIGIVGVLAVTIIAPFLEPTNAKYLLTAKMTGLFGITATLIIGLFRH